VAPTLGVELLSLSEGPVVRIGTDLATRVSGKRDGIAIVREWSEALSSRYRILVPVGEFRLKRYPCLPVAEHGHPSGDAPDVRRVEIPLYHAGQVLGVLVAYLSVGPGDDRRIDGLIASAAGQLGLFLHKHADQEKIRFLANHDALTGLLNHWSFQNIFEREFERHRRHERNLSLLFVDIDHFKRINDDYGHQVGDRVLREIARILTANLRKIDYVFRYGGDEFVVLMTETDSQRASMLAQRIRGAVKREVGGIAPSRFPVSISIGIADCSDLTQTEREELLFRADVALYQAKNSGRDRIRVADRPLDRAAGVN
jgi:diguanylate cyclase (GGDEF)-like protein